MYVSDRSLWQLMIQAFERLSCLALPSNSAVVFDIDMTLIDEGGERIEPVCWFYDKVLESGFVPVLITARPSIKEVVDETEFQLYQANIMDYESIYFRNQSETDYATYKKNCRRNLWNRGYKVIMSIGDKPWDIGEYGGIGVLLH
jgi:predicted secreted acid phosphatase